MHLRRTIGAFAIGLLLPTGALALSFTWDLTEEFSGAQQPENSYSVTIADAGVDTVTITMSVSGTSATEYASRWYFNYTGDSSLLTITGDAGNPVGATVISQSANCCQADGDGNFDILFDFPPPGSNRFVAGETVVYTITGVAGLDASDFWTLSQGGGNSPEGLLTAAHIQGIGANDGSGWVTTPEPGAVGVFSMGLLLAGGLIRRFARRED